MKTILNRKVTPMLPEPTIPKPPAARPAIPRPWVMTPLFGAPASTDRGASPAQVHHAAPSPRRASRRANERPPAGPGNRSRVTVKTGPRKDTADLLAITLERLRRALWRSFLRYGITGDLDTAVHAAMDVIGPVLEARDAEIMRLHEMPGRVKPPSRPRASSGRTDDTVLAGRDPGGSYQDRR